MHVVKLRNGSAKGIRKRLVWRDELRGLSRLSWLVGVVEGLLGKFWARFFYLIKVVGGDVLEGLVGAAGPGDFDAGDSGGVAETEVGTEVALGKVAGAADDFADLVDVARSDFDSGAEGVAI